MLKKCTYNSQYIVAHYAQFEPTTMLTITDMRHEETQLHYPPFHFYIICSDSKVGLINHLPVHNVVQIL